MTPRPVYGVFRVTGWLFRWELAVFDTSWSWRPVSYHLTRWDATRRMRYLLRREARKSETETE